MGDQYAILFRRVRGAMVDEIRRVTKWKQVVRKPVVSLDTYWQEDAESHTRVGGPLTHTSSAEDEALRLIRVKAGRQFIVELLRLAEPIQRNRDWYILNRGHEVTLKTIGDAYGVSESRVSQACTQIQNEIDRLIPFVSQARPDAR